MSAFEGGLTETGKFSRETFKKAARNLQTDLVKFNKVEVYNAYVGCMQIVDAYGLTKNFKDGGEVIDFNQCCQQLGNMSQEKVTSLYSMYERATFMAIDTDGDGYISRNEWSKFLKVRKTYESEEQALRSFDSIDKNDDGIG